MIQYQGGGPLKLRSRKQVEILRWLEEKREVTSSELASQVQIAFQCRAIPPWLPGLVSIINREVCRSPSFNPELKPYPKPEPTPDQKAILEQISKAIQSNRFSPFLIHGVTGSGKTEIYLRAIEEVLALGKEAIVLVPEISLTPQLLSRFKDRFGGNLALLHSRLGKGERYDQWRRVLRGEVSIAIGARSAIFRPF